MLVQAKTILPWGGVVIPNDILALIIFWVAAATDLLDGYLARRLRQATTIGTLLRTPIPYKIRIIRRLGFMNLDGREKRLAMDQIEDLPRGQFVAGIAQGNLIPARPLWAGAYGKGGTHGARAHNHHLSRSPCSSFIFAPLVAVQIVSSD